MKVAKFNVSKKMILWALERKGTTAFKLAARFPNLQKWLDGTDSPTMNQLESFSKATSTPLGFFFMDEPPEVNLHIPHFRTTSDKDPAKPSTELLETVQQMELRQTWYKEYLINRGAGDLGYVGSLNNKVDASTAAIKIRSTLGLSDNWAANLSNWSDALKALIEAMENIGILVIVNGIVGNNTSRPLNVSEFRGFVLCDKTAPLVFVNGADSKAAQMFTLAHELVHIFFGQSAAFDLKNLLPSEDHDEKLCNQIAAEFLVPQDQFVKIWALRKNGQKVFKAISQYFKVSPLVIARRALDLKLITKKAFFEYYDEYQAELDDKKSKAKAKDGGGDFYASQNLRVGKSFGDFVVRAVKEGSLLYTDAYRLTGLSGNSFEKFANLRTLKKVGSG